MKTTKIVIFGLIISWILATGCSLNTKLEHNEINNQKEAQKIIQEIQNTSTKEFVEYENKKYNFKIQIPGNRTFQEDSLWFDIKLSTPKDDDINENFFSDFIEKENKDTKLNNWKSIVYEFSDKWLNLKAQQTVFIQDNKAYVFTYTATKETFEKYIDTINKIINSFTILN